MIGIAIKPTIGVGDALQFSSVPENYFRHTGERLYDVNRPWFFDYNPFVVRSGDPPEKQVQMWNWPKQFDWPNPRQEGEPRVYLCNAEIYASVLGVPAKLIRPRLYKYEDFPYAERSRILLHVDGRSHGVMPQHVIDHVLRKYGPTKRLYQVGKSDIDLGIPKIETETLWDLAAFISQASMLIGMDSGPSWIAACFPDVVVKKLRTKPRPDYFKTWIPLAIDNVHAHWDDRCHQIFNASDEDIGFTSSFRRI